MNPRGSPRWGTRAISHALAGRKPGIWAVYLNGMKTRLTVHGPIQNAALVAFATKAQLEAQGLFGSVSAGSVQGPPGIDKSPSELLRTLKGTDLEIVTEERWTGVEPPQATTWVQMGEGFPGDDPRVRIVFDQLAPVSYSRRFPSFEFGHESEPTPKEVWGMATKIVEALTSGGFISVGPRP